ncbi:MAG: hypothetical protein ACXABY_23405 [Candidatus Thorarchaeota archaeon]|jgi:hypothetical protein
MAINNQNPPRTSERTIDQFKSRLTGGIARPNLFEVVLAFPDGVVDSDVSDIDVKSRFLVKAAALPASNIAPITVPFRGRQLKIAGDRTFDEWTITVINDTDFAIRSSFERWMNSMSKVSDNAGNVNPEDYTRDAYVYQLGRAPVAAGSQSSEQNLPILRTYKFYSVFPTNVSQIDLSYDQSDAVEEFTVTLQVQWWEADGNGGAVA